MNSLWATLAQANVSDMGRRFQRDGGGIALDRLLIGLLILGCIALSAWLFAMYYNWRENNASNSPSNLFKQLCRAHKLDFRCCRLLRMLARWQKLPHPGRLFLEPERFDPANVGPSLKQHQATLLKLRDHIFGKQLAHG